MTDNIQVVRVLSTAGAAAGVSSLPSARLPLEVAVESVRVTPTGGIEQNMGDALGSPSVFSYNSLSSELTIADSTITVLPTHIVGSLLNIVGKVAQAPHITLDSFASIASYTNRRANGTDVAPTALLSGDNISQVSARGYGATKYSTAGRARIQFSAAENWNDTKQGTRIALQTTKNGTVTTVDAVSVENDGAITILSLPPASAAATGVVGTITWIAGFLYVCVATDTWQRTAIATW